MITGSKSSNFASTAPARKSAVAADLRGLASTDFILGHRPGTAGRIDFRPSNALAPVATSTNIGVVPIGEAQ